MKKLSVAIVVLVLALMVAVPTLVFAHTQAVQSTVFYACESPATVGSISAGEVDANSITQDDALSCTDDTNFTTRVTWNVAGQPGIQGKPGTDGSNGTNGSSVLTSDGVPTGACTNGDSDVDLSNGEVYSCVSLAWVDTTHTIKGSTGPAGPAGVPFTHAPCTETQAGSAQQENLIFCVSGVEKDGGAVYLAAIGAAKVHILLGTPVSDNPSVDWGGLAINYVTFTSQFHAEYHSDGKVRIFNASNQQVF